VSYFILRLYQLRDGGNGTRQVRNRSKGIVGWETCGRKWPWFIWEGVTISSLYPHWASFCLFVLFPALAPAVRTCRWEHSLLGLWMLYGNGSL